MEKSIYDLELNEVIEYGYKKLIQRVPGGWIYHFNVPVFVPYNNEFQEKQPTIKTEKFNFKKSLIELGVDEKIVSDWLKVRAKKKSANTETAFKAIKKQILLTTHPANDCIKMAVEKSWSGFKSQWFFKEQKPGYDKGLFNNKNVNDQWTK